MSLTAVAHHLVRTGLARSDGVVPVSWARDLVTGRGREGHQPYPTAPGHLANYRSAVDDLRARVIVVLVTDQHPRLRDLVRSCRQAFPDARLSVVLLGPGERRLPADSDQVRFRQVEGPGSLRRLLWQHEAYEVLLDFVDLRRSRGRTLAGGLYPVSEGGLYVVHHLPERDPDASFGRAELHDLIRTDEHLAFAARDRRQFGDSLVIVKRGRHVFKLRDGQLAGESFAGRLRPVWGAELARREQLSYESRATVTVNHPENLDRFPPRATVRARYLREYRDVICGPRQLVLRGDLVMPVSFHHPGRQHQHTRGGVYVDTDVDRLPAKQVSEPIPTLGGAFFHLISEYPGHFGHVMTEDLGRMWGWFEAKRRYPELKLLVSAEPSETTIRGFQLVLLEALGVSPDDIVCINRPVRVSRLIGAGPQFHNRRFVDPDLAGIWDRLRDRLQPESDPGAPERIFVTRPPEGQRNCVNAAELEGRFVDAGFVLVRPETLSIPEQVRVFSNADVIAGYGGSGMFGMVYSRRPGRRIVISSNQYTASNEFLISSVKGDDYHHFWCPAEVEHPEHGWSREAFFSDYTFDFDNDGERLGELLDAAARPRSGRGLAASQPI